MEKISGKSVSYTHLDVYKRQVNTLAEKIADLLDILRSRARIIAIIKEDLIQIRDSFAVPRRSQFIEADLELGDEDFIEREEMVVTLSHQGYIKRTALSEYRTQNRGGRGRAGMSLSLIHI